MKQEEVPVPEPFFEDLDIARRHPGPQSCCTVWTLGLLLSLVLIIGLKLIFW